MTALTAEAGGSRVRLSVLMRASSDILRPERVARAAFLGWLPVVLVNAVFVPLANVRLSPAQRVLHHLYDAGQVLALAAISWLAARLLWRLPVRVRAPLGAAWVFATCYALVGGDLESFIERHPQSHAPWRLIFAAVTCLGVLGAGTAGWLLARVQLRVARVAVGPALGLSAGVALAVVNHLILELDYQGAHFVLAWAAASLIGMSTLGWLAERDLPRRASVAAFGLGALSMLSVAIAPGPVVRTALLRSSGAVAAPFVAHGWALMHGVGAVSSHASSPWFESRRGLPPIAPESLPGKPKHPLVIVLTVDALRADVVELAGHKKAVPNLRAMARSSVRFTRAWSPAACTGPTMKQFFLGSYYSQSATGIDRGPYFPALLERAGVRTTHLATHPVLMRGKGIGEGFGKERDIGFLAVSEKVVAEVLAELDAQPTGPRFIYSHILDPHSPYDRGRVTGSPKKRYVAEVSVVDAAIGTLRSELVKRKLTDSTYLIVAADHGEAFKEHGYNHHARTMYEEMIRIPLLIEGPGVKPRRIERSVSLLDVPPTILALFDLPTPARYMGQSLIPFLRGETPTFSRPLATDGQNKMRAMLFDDRMKAIIDEKQGTEELYDLKKDPKEKRNLAERDDAQAYFATVREFFAKLDKPSARQ